MRDKVLLVDDVSMFLELQKDYLQTSAVRILTAKDGAEALRICREERPALVFMDLHMPIMNGVECCDAIKKDPQLCSTRVVLVTSGGNHTYRDICLSARCDDFLTKPLDRHEFLQMARRFVPSIDRRDKRISCRLKVKFRVFGVTLSGCTEDLSRTGLYLSTSYDLEEDAVLDLLFYLPEPDGTVIATKGRVAWLNTGKDRQKPSLPEGVGVEFTSLSEESSKALEQFFKSRELQ